LIFETKLLYKLMKFYSLFFPLIALADTAKLLETQIDLNKNEIDHIHK